MFFEYYNFADGNCFRANHKYAFYKNSTQIHKTTGVTTVWKKIQRTQKCLYILVNMKHARNNNKFGLNPKHKERKKFQQ